MLSSLESIVKVLKPKIVVIDSPICRLHYKFTFGILIACAVAISTKQVFGEPIHCFAKDSVKQEVMDTYCWISSTFSIPAAWKLRVGSEVPYPGVGKHIEQHFLKDSERVSGSGSKVYHAYYQWVCIALFFQACLFYAPHMFWKSLEGGQMSSLTGDLRSPIGERADQSAMIAHYLHSNRGTFSLYLFAYLISEASFLSNIVGQIFFMDNFLGGHFLKYGSNVLSFPARDWRMRYDPMIEVFPRVTKCTFHLYGFSGSLQKLDSMCILPLNIINEKVYIFLWFWFIMLAAATGLMLLFRLLLLSNRRLRLRILRFRCSCNDRQLKYILDEISIADWFILDMISSNVKSIHFSSIISTYYSLCKSRRKSKEMTKQPEEKKQLIKVAKTREETPQEKEAL